MRRAALACLVPATALAWGCGEGLLPRGGTEDRRPPGATRQEDLAAIERLREADMRAVEAGDTAVLVSLWTGDVVMLPPDGPIRTGKEENRRALRAGAETSGAFETLSYGLDFRELKLMGDRAVEWGTYRGVHLTEAGGDTLRVSGRLMRVLRRQPDGSWKVARSIWTGGDAGPRGAGAGG